MLRRALFQVHLWTGLALGLYIIVISLSGSAIVFRRELDLALCPQIIRVKPSGARLSDAQLAAAARELARGRFWQPDVHVEVRGARVPGAAVEVWYLFRGGRYERLLDPYTGQDLGDAVACEPAFVTGIAELHDDLLGGELGRAVNGAGAGVVLLMGLTGLVLWWRGTAPWRRSVQLRWNAPWRIFIRDLHSVLGFWILALLLLWGVSGAYFAFPGPFEAGGDLLVTHSAGHVTSSDIDTLTDWLSTLHFGRVFGLWVKVLWVLLGLVPSALTVTGALMWWSRSRRKARFLPARPTAAASATRPVRERKSSAAG